jgi:hypothetical protein
MADKKDQVLHLEHQETNDEFTKPVPIVEKQDNFGSHEVCQFQSLLSPITLTRITENRPSRDCAGEKTGQENHGGLSTCYFISETPTNLR